MVEVAGHLGVKKTYDRVLLHFFLASSEKGPSNVVQNLQHLSANWKAKSED